MYTLLREEEVRHFKGLLRKLDNAFVADFKLRGAAALEPQRPRLQAALAQMEALVAADAAAAAEAAAAASAAARPGGGGDRGKGEGKKAKKADKG